MAYPILLSETQIHAKVVELGKQISKDFAATKEPVVFIGILKGSFIFLADLVREVNVPCHIDFLEASSYGAGTVSSGEVKLYRDVFTSIQGKHLIVVEDIVDTGNTISYLLEHLKTHKPASVSVCALLHKPARKIKEVKIDYLGFTIEDHFVIGYGLDVNNLHRELKDIVIYQE